MCIGRGAAHRDGQRTEIGAAVAMAAVAIAAAVIAIAIVSVARRAILIVHVDARSVAGLFDFGAARTCGYSVAKNVNQNNAKPDEEYTESTEPLMQETTDEL